VRVHANKPTSVTEKKTVGNKAKRHDYDAGVYFSGCYDTQTFWAPAGRGGGGYVGGPEVTRPDQRQWELEKAATLRKFVDRLDDVWVRIVDHAWENPGAQFVSVWTEARLREVDLEVQARKDEHAELGKKAARKARKEARLAKKARARRAQLEPGE
jgi:hypothetical protein